MDVAATLEPRFAIANQWLYGLEQVRIQGNSLMELAEAENQAEFDNVFSLWTVNIALAARGLEPEGIDIPTIRDYLNEWDRLLRVID